MQYLYFNNEPLTSLGPLLYKGAPLSQRELLLASKNDTLIKLVKDNMEEYLRHFIDCYWGTCYNTLYRSVIKPHLDDVQIVENVLKSDLIELRENTLISKDGVKLYYDLYLHLYNVKSNKVREYVHSKWSEMN